LSVLYPSWIEIPVIDLERALAFYRTVFGLTDTPIYDEPDMRIALLLPSAKGERAPGVSLVMSPHHRPGDGAHINFHMDTHAALADAMAVALSLGGRLTAEVVDMGDGVRYCMLRDCEGNPVALSSYEAPPPTD
jgi:predicted enzyme related to lactoylglutathione lyase